MNKHTNKFSGFIFICDNRCAAQLLYINGVNDYIQNKNQISWTLFNNSRKPLLFKNRKPRSLENFLSNIGVLRKHTIISISFKPYAYKTFDLLIDIWVALLASLLLSYLPLLRWRPLKLYSMLRICIDIYIKIIFHNYIVTQHNIGTTNNSIINTCFCFYIGIFSLQTSLTNLSIHFQPYCFMLFLFSSWLFQLKN